MRPCVRNDVHPSEFVFQISVEYKLTKVNSVARAPMVDSISSTKLFSCDIFIKIGNHSQMVGNHGQRPDITAKCGPKYMLLHIYKPVLVRHALIVFDLLRSIILLDFFQLIVKYISPNVYTFCPWNERIDTTSMEYDNTKSLLWKKLL